MKAQAQLEMPIQVEPIPVEARRVRVRRPRRLVAGVKALLAKGQRVTIAVDSAQRRDELLELFTPSERTRLSFRVGPIEPRPSDRLSPDAAWSRSSNYRRG